MHGLCDSCIDEIDWCFENKYELSMDEFYFDDILVCCNYGFRPRTLIYKLKLQGQTYIAEGLGKLMAERVLQDIKDNGSIYDLIIPVPLSKKKESLRGYNQAELLSQYISEGTGIPMRSDILFKVKDTSDQKKSSAEERVSKFKDVFKVIFQKDENILSGKSVLLVDDVITTGSTADACAKELKNAGAKSVCVLCFAGAAQVNI